MESCVSELRVRAPPLTEIRTLRAAHGDYLRLGLRVTDHGAERAFRTNATGLVRVPTGVLRPDDTAVRRSCACETTPHLFTRDRQ